MQKSSALPLVVEIENDSREFVTFETKNRESRGIIRNNCNYFQVKKRIDQNFDQKRIVIIWQKPSITCKYVHCVLNSTADLLNAMDFQIL